MAAALHPAETNYLYFVAKPAGGGHQFSATLAEHDKAVREYQEWNSKPTKPPRKPAKKRELAAVDRAHPAARRSASRNGRLCCVCWRRSRRVICGGSYGLREIGHSARAGGGGVRQESFDALESSLLKLLAEYERATRARRLARPAAGDRSQGPCPSGGAQSQSTRAEKQEMILWMLTWLENPPLFPEWVRLRRAARREAEIEHARPPTQTAGPRRPAELRRPGADRRGPSLNELRDRLKRRAAKQGGCRRSDRALKEAGFLNDRRWPIRSPNWRRENQGLGKTRVMRDLMARRIAPAVAQQAVDQAYSRRGRSGSDREASWSASIAVRIWANCWANQKHLASAYPQVCAWPASAPEIRFAC